MSTFLTWLDHSRTEAVGWTLLHFVWQGAAVAAGLALVLAALRRSRRRQSARTRYAVCCTAIAIMTLCPLATVVWCWPSPRTETTALQPKSEANQSAASSASNPSSFAHGLARDPNSDIHSLASLPSDSNLFSRRGATEVSPGQSAHGSAPPTWRSRFRPFIPWLVAGWLGGVLCLSLRLTLIWFRVKRLCRVQVPAIGDEALALLTRIVGRLQISRPVRLGQSALVEVPTVIGWLCPIILLPASALAGLAPEQLEAILVHELAHIHRCDYLVNLFQNVIETLLFYHPAVWWVSGQIRQEREYCCDDLATSLCGDTLGYAEALLRMEELRQPAGRLALAASGGQLLPRIRRLLGTVDHDRLPPWWQSGATTLVVLSGVLIGVQGMMDHANSADSADRELSANHTSDDEERTSDLSAVAQLKRAASDTENLTPALLADRIEDAMRQYHSIDYTVEYDETVNTNDLMNSANPNWVEGHGKYTWRSDGKRWFLDDNAFSHNSGDPQLVYERRISGFDGKRHYHLRRGSELLLGEEEGGRQRADAKNVLWRCANVAENMLTFLRRPEAKIVRWPEIENHHCVVVDVDCVPDWDKTKTRWHLEVTLSPEQSFLPLKAVWEHNGKVTSESEMRGLKQTADGLWYPLMIRTNRNLPEPTTFERPRTDRIVSFERRTAANGKSYRDEELRYEPPLGIDIVDYRLGVGWCNDPWWLELAPWIKEKFDWPRPDTAELIHAKSYCDPVLAGQPAPAIDAAEWLNGPVPGPWNRKDRFASVLYFFGGGLFSPHPQLASALRTWHQRYKEDGVELIGIATSGHDEVTKQSVEELNLKFPIAIDRASDRKGSFGRTFDAFKMQAYMGIVVIDPQGQVRIVGAAGGGNAVSPLDAAVLPLFEAADRKPKWAGSEFPMPQNFQEMNASLPNAVFNTIRGEWKRRAALQGGTARIRGTVKTPVAEREQPAAGNIEVKAAPQLWLMGSNSPSHHMYDTDRARVVNVICDAAGNYDITDLRKGTYTLTFSRPGFAAAERKVTLPADDSAIVTDVDLTRTIIAGQVVDAAGRSIPRATIRATFRHLKPPAKYPAADRDLPGPVIADDNGNFVFKSPVAGAHTLEISANGFPPYIAEIVPLGTRDLKIVMKMPGQN